RDIVPIYVKIGGPEARNDIRELGAIQVDGIIAPMIESAYALRNFISTLRDLLGPTTYERVEKGINLETITAFQNMNSILGAPEAKELVQVTAARSDLSGSMDLSPDDERVLEICSVIIARCREYDLRTSVGGGIHPGITMRIIDEISPDTINTRHMVMRSSVLRKDPEAIAAKHLYFEVDLYRYLSTMPSVRQRAYAERARIIEMRLQKAAHTPVPLPVLP
ncbi:MAG: aldolase, partial [Spirochaetia bacterium]|nr:aldolase [Spirochaetia bacterium]